MLDIDRQRQRISLGLKQTQEDPWQRVVDTYNIGDELEGNVTKVVTFGAFVEILDGVEGLVHISELAQHHVENPREIIQPGDPVRVKILEIDSERRRLSLSIKRVEGQVLPVRPIEPPTDGRQLIDDVPELGLSEDVFVVRRAVHAPSEFDGVDGSAEPLAAARRLAEGEVGPAEPTRIGPRRSPRPRRSYSPRRSPRPSRSRPRPWRLPTRSRGCRRSPSPSRSASSPQPPRRSSRRRLPWRRPKRQPRRPEAKLPRPKRARRRRRRTLRRLLRHPQPPTGR